MLNVVLVEPEIPPNTGNVARLCAATKSRLHLVQPLGFEINDHTLKRSGMDYWNLVEWQLWESWSALELHLQDQSFYLLSSKAEKSLYQAVFCDGDWLIFGRETKGLPESLLEKYKSRTLRIPMLNQEARCLNLATSVGVVVYSVLREIKYI